LIGSSTRPFTVVTAGFVCGLCLFLVAETADAQDTPSVAVAADGALADIDVDDVQDVFLSLTIHDDLSPYGYTRYELKNRGRTLILSLSKSLLGGFGDLQDVALLEFDELPVLIQGLVNCGIDRASSEVDANDASTTYSLDIVLDAYHREQVWSGATNRPGTAYWCASRLIIDTYAAIGDPVPFVDLFWNDGEYGELTTSSVPPARLFVDGRDTGLTTPVYNLRLAPGVHILRYVNETLEIDREYDATVVEGHTTRINVELR